MGSAAADVWQSKRSQFHFPVSPSHSTSPSPGSPAKWPTHRPPKGDTTDSEGYLTEKSSSNRRNPAKSRALTLPPAAHRPMFRRTSSVSSSASSSSSLSAQASVLPSHPSNSGIGRKVAATLQLFKETADDSQSIDAQPSANPHHRSASLGNVNGGDVAEAKFEFVKRSEWPDREAAVLRRDKSTVTLHRVKTRESVESSGGPEERKVQERKPSAQDLMSLAQWRKDVSTWDDGIDRGRRRERVEDTFENDMHTIPPWSPPEESVTPPERSTSRSHLPTPIRPSPSLSPWSTDDESGWDSTSASTSTTSHSTAFTHPQNLSSIPVFDDDISPITSFPSPDTHYRQYADVGEGDENTYLLDMGLNVSHDTLPHIPLRPFRNQVGGHSAIYKFTKRAVCKVNFLVFYLHYFLIFLSR